MTEISIPASAAIAATSRYDARGLIRRTQGLLVPGILVIVWEAVVRAGWVSAHLLPPPSELVTTLADLAGNGALAGHIGVSGLRVLIGFCIGAGLAVAIGAAVGLSRRTEALLDPTFQALRAIPSLAWGPLLLLWLGVDEAPGITLIAIGAFFPVYLNFVAGIHNVDRKLVEVGGIYGLTGYRLIARIFLPAALPNLFTGLRSGLSLSWMFLVAAELIAATRGLGYLLTDGRETGRADLVIVAIIVLALLGKTSDSLLRWLEDRLLGWRDVHDSRPS
ncbi:ABC transporter permease [Accumulibacter sp.]|uniref:ABC transporter permease n=1 Tax=Accumulibacter sp. TaxID=2053492 RepID=UPI0026299791|nr:ABC transporter permease [Accumulibacter sp.]